MKSDNSQMNKQANQQEIMKKYRRDNIILTLIFLGLLSWVATLFYQEIHHKNQQVIAVNQETMLRIERDENTLAFEQKNNQWQMTEPFTSLASSTVIEAFLERLHSNCQVINAKELPRELQFYALARTTNNDYHIGEINPATDRVYVKQLSTTGEFQQLALCDKLLISMALAPAINFIDKSLYHGDLLEIQGSFGRLNDFSGIDLSVLQIAKANQQQAQSASISDLTFVSQVNGKKVSNSYRILPPDSTDKGMHILLFEPNKSLIYVIATNKKINAILGL